MKVHILILATLVICFACGNAGEVKDPDPKETLPEYREDQFGKLQYSSHPPKGMIFAMPKKGSWEFKLLVKYSDAERVGGVDMATLRGDGYKIPLSIQAVATTASPNKAYVHFTLPDSVARKLILRIYWSESNLKGGKAICYTVPLIKYLKK